MIRIATLLLLVMFWSGAACAAVYKCRDKDGILFLTNKRSKFPPGCVQVGGPVGEEAPPSPPEETPPAAPGSEREMNDRRRSVSPPGPQALPEPAEETKPEAPSPPPEAPEGEAELTPREAPETGSEGATPDQPDEQAPPQDGDADERAEEVPNATDQPDQPSLDTPVEGEDKGE